MSDLSVRLDALLSRVLAIHFDPQSGTPYWLERMRELGIDPRESIRGVEDLHQLGPMDPKALACRPIEDFVPRSMHERRCDWLMVETGGTLGAPKFAVHRRDEFYHAFVEPFVVAARRARFPRGENWLFIGPSGPHVIGLAARACATALDSPEPFMIDFDPRWAKRLPAESFALERYRSHLQEQALRILETQTIGVLFATPAVLSGLGEQMNELRRAAIRGIHFGGMPVSSELRGRLGEIFPNSVMLSGYGNTLLGMAPELALSADGSMEYFPYGLRLLLRVIPLECEGGVVDQRIKLLADYGQRGQVMAHRLDETQLLVNLIERDTAVRIPPLLDAQTDGFVLDGVGHPRPLATAEAAKPQLGLY